MTERSRPLSWGGTAPGTRGPRAEHEGGQARGEAARDARRRTAVTVPESQRQGPENGRVDPAGQVTGRPFRGRWGHTHAWTSPGLDAGNGRPRRGRGCLEQGGRGDRQQREEPDRGGRRHLTLRVRPGTLESPEPWLSLASERWHLIDLHFSL